MYNKKYDLIIGVLCILYSLFLLFNSVEGSSIVSTTKFVLFIIAYGIGMFNLGSWSA